MGLFMFVTLTTIVLCCTEPSCTFAGVSCSENRVINVHSASKVSLVEFIDGVMRIWILLLV